MRKNTKSSFRNRMKKKNGIFLIWNCKGCEKSEISGHCNSRDRSENTNECKRQLYGLMEKERQGSFHRIWISICRDECNNFSGNSYRMCAPPCAGNTVFVICFFLISCFFVSCSHRPLPRVEISNRVIEKNRKPKPEKQTFRPELYKDLSLALGIPLNGRENLSLLTEAAQWLGVPYKWGGCTKKGVDCSCLVKHIYQKVYGINLNRTSITIYRENITRVRKSRLHEGDILCFRINSSRVSHVGIYLKHGKFIHAGKTGGVCISDLSTPYFKKYFYCAGRVINPGDKNRIVRNQNHLANNIRLGELMVAE